MRAIWIPAFLLVCGLVSGPGRVVAGPLDDAVQAGDILKVQELISAGADVAPRPVDAVSNT